MDLLIPCAGKSSRFSTTRPKYLLTMPNGKLMIQETVESFIPHFEQIFFAVLKEHDEKFHSSIILNKLFPTSKVMIIDEVTRGQADTVVKMLEHFNITDSFLVKDSDSHFNFSSSYESNKNYVSVCNAKETPETLLYNKSFVEISNQRYILRTSLEIISNYFSCGGYFFSNALEFIDSFHKYEEMQMEGEFFISNVIDIMIDNNHIFHPKECTDLKDWGTFEDWINYKKSKSSYFFDIDGVIYENGSEFWEPKWGENKIIIDAKNKINRLFDSGNQIILTTSRPEKFREITIKQLNEDGILYHQLIMGVFHGTRYLINDYSNTNPYPAAKAINTRRNSGDFIEKID
jgi:NDP-sugar pyrophosphorylase family protein